MQFAINLGSHGRAYYMWAREVLLSLVSTRMSAVAFHLDYFIYPPVILALLAIAAHSAKPVELLVLSAMGMATWTLAEYFLHRYALHHWPYFSKYHLAHHEAPRSMIGAPTLPTFSFFFLIAFLPIWLVSSMALACGFFAGFLSGYLIFAAVHEAVHHSENQSRPMRYFKRLHAIHHHGNSTKNFGVITDFWDRVFGTYSNEMGKR